MPPRQAAPAPAAAAPHDAVAAGGAGGRGLADSARRIAPLAWPVFVGQLAVLGFGTVDTLLVARASPQDLAALAVGAAAYITIFIGLMGIVMAVSPIVGQLYGARRLADAGHQLHQAAWIAIGLAAIGCAALAFPSPFLALSQVTPEVEGKVRGYLVGLALALPAALLFAAYRGFNIAVSRPKAVMALQLAGLAAKVPLTVVLVFGVELPASLGGGIPALGVAGCGLATAIAMWLQVAIAGWLLWRDPFYAPFQLRGRGLHPPDARALRTQLRLGLPMGASIMIEVTGFAFMAIFIARLGTTAVAGHQVAANLVSLLFMLPLALANATSTLVAQRVGAGDAADARRLGWHGIGLGLALAALVGTTVFLLREPIVRLYTPDAAIAAAALPLLAFVAVFHVVDALQVVASFVLRAWRIAVVPMLIYAGSLWVVGLGGGYLLAFDLTGAVPPALQGARGFWAASTTGLALAGLSLTGFLAWVMRRQTARVTPSPPPAPGWRQVPALAITAAALAGSLLPQVPMPDASWGDKVVHLLGYAALAASWQLALRRPPGAVWLGATGFGIGIELLQAVVPWRTFQWGDMAANALGAAAGLVAVWIAAGLWRSRRT